jgi:hypothetical protein
MTASFSYAPARGIAPGSPRVRLARLSRDAALLVPGVAGTDCGPTGMWVTVGDQERVDGVRCVAAGNDDYEVSLRLRCEMVPLRELGEAVEASVVRTASAAGIGLSQVRVLIADVVEPGCG